MYHKSSNYYAPLDGMRTISIIAVLLYHSGSRWFKGGFLGVETFLVISGFIITTLLQREYMNSSNINFISFYKRRLRRLLPDMVFTVFFTLCFIAVLYPGEMKKTLEDVIPSLSYTSNWFYIFNERSYFELTGRPRLLEHLWSLSVEFQFYLVWPFLCLLLFKLRRKTALFLTLAVATASTFLMAYLYTPGIDPSRIYFGTDTRASGFLIGGALALVLPGLKNSKLCNKFLSASANLVGIIGLALCYYKFSSDSGILYKGGFALVACLSAICIGASLLNENTFLSKLLGSKVMNIIGMRTYNIYICHWPIFCLTQPYLDVWIDGWKLLVLRISLTVIAGEITYRFVDTPIRNGFYVKIARNLFSSDKKFIRKTGIIGTVVALTGCLIFVVYSRANVAPNDTYAAIAAQQKQLIEQKFDEDINSRDNAVPLSKVLPSITPKQLNKNDSRNFKEEDYEAFKVRFEKENIVLGINEKIGDKLRISVEDTKDQKLSVTWSKDSNGEHNWESTPYTVDMSCPFWYSWDVGDHQVSAKVENGKTSKIITTTIKVIEKGKKTDYKKNFMTDVEQSTGYINRIYPSVEKKRRVFAIGDSVMIGAANRMYSFLDDDLNVDAQVNRWLSAGQKLISDYKNKDIFGDVVIIHLGSNGPIEKEELRNTINIIKACKKIFLINNKVPRSYEEENNNILKEVGSEYSNVEIIDWRKNSINSPNNFTSDGIHLTNDGAILYTQLILDALQKYWNSIDR